MRGFCTKGILLCPKMETFGQRSDDYHSYLRRGVDKAIKFFSNVGITMQCFTTDEVANALRPGNVEWVNSCTPEDLFFIKQSCNEFSSISDGLNLDHLYVESRLKYPTKRGLSVEDRIALVMKRDKFISNKHIKSQKLIITFEHLKNPHYNTETKAGDGRIIVKVNHSNFVAQAYLSGNPIDIVQVLQYNGAARPIHTWEV